MTIKDLVNNVKPADNQTYTKEQELFLVYERLLDVREAVASDPELEEFLDKASQYVTEFQENYPEICEEYKFNKKEIKC